ncbi:MAG: outer membrane beta-barrel protein, partial [bacterium]|nr:outer membrane beta-barrel protein [bacterium]
VSGAADSFNGDYHDLQQFWGEVQLPIGQRGVTVRGGKIATIIGPETIERATNNQASMSWGNGLALPFTHWGAVATAPLTDGLDLSLGVVNGWDNVYGRSTGPSGLLGFSGEPTDWFSWSLTGALGADQDRFLGTGNGIATFSAGNFSFMTSLILTGQGENGPEAPPGTFFAAFINPRYQFHHHVALSGRAELAHDPDGIRTGLSQTLGGFALALPIRPVPESHYRYFPLEIRPEIRHDVSSAAPFLAGEDETAVSGQTTFGVSATLNWENWVGIHRSPPE